MFRRFVLAALSGIAATAGPALGQEQAVTVPSPAPPDQISSADGYRRAETQNGFQLIEHGIWDVSLPTSSGTTPAHAAASAARLSYRSPGAGKPAPTNFRRAAYLPHVYAAETKYALPVGLLDALVWTESRYDPLAVSRAGAAGLGQLMPGTARELGVINRFDPLENISGAARYLRQMLDRFGVVHLALAAYNAGPGAVERAKGIPRNGETPGYVRSVLDRWRP